MVSGTAPGSRQQIRIFPPTTFGACSLRATGHFG
jgi:hypothetical protein